MPLDVTPWWKTDAAALLGVYQAAHAREMHTAESVLPRPKAQYTRIQAPPERNEAAKLAVRDENAREAEEVEVSTFCCDAKSEEKKAKAEAAKGLSGWK
ncbi:hypothetical protein MGYG_09071 [Nannizzia gypsea CBS 118893]|uniref:Uncharacterized protein n=1 Tax=Arthroderma gypseum (strain ATCC MYA-4604 / CBS 118893) TaxID=535722 RepID=E4UYD0_ARTGP|nr:hypothetical protein MGYG_09071 [Nannizzia gypsea CBS 118893]EFR02093.1 hypothetical protein MGYG_09071 [Nannizzia gypsea CBS 118893]